MRWPTGFYDNKNANNSRIHHPLSVLSPLVSHWLYPYRNDIPRNQSITIRRDAMSCVWPKLMRMFLCQYESVHPQIAHHATNWFRGRSLLCNCTQTYWPQLVADKAPTGWPLNQVNTKSDDWDEHARQWISTIVGVVSCRCHQIVFGPPQLDWLEVVGRVAVFISDLARICDWRHVCSCRRYGKAIRVIVEKQKVFKCTNN